MAEKSAIAWTDATWPIVAGCEYVSPGCSNCWAVRDSWRLAHNPNPRVHNAYFGTVDKTETGKLVWSGIVRPLWARLAWPLKWKKPRRIFVCSQADLFHPRVPADFIAKAFETMARCPQHTFQILTKHATRTRKLLTEDLPYEGPKWPLPNVWIGATAEDQERLDARLSDLRATPAAVRWLSIEPQLEAVTIPWQVGGIGPVCSSCTGAGHYHDNFNTPCPDCGQTGRNPRALHWVVCGGESTQTRTNTRPFDIEWARHLRGQCQAAGVAFFMKQLGSKPILTSGSDVDLLPVLPTGKSTRYKWHEPQYWPADLRVQEFPA